MEGASLRLLAIAFVPLFLVFYPRTDSSVINFGLLPLLLILCIIGAYILSQKSGQGIPRLLGGFLFANLCCLVVAWMSMTRALDDMRVEGISEIVRLLLIGALAVYGSIVAQAFPASVKRGLIFAALLIIVGELVVGLLGLVFPGAFDAVYSSDKAKGLERGVRVVGTVGNPNFFAWITSQCALLLFIFSHRLSIRYIGLAIGVVCVLISGSRSMILVFPLAIFVVWVARSERGKVMRVLVGALFALVLGVGMTQVISSYSGLFGYASQMMVLFEGGRLEDIVSFQLRLDLWAASWDLFLSDDSSAKWFLGLGPIEAFRVLDNDVLFVFLRFGILGIAAQVGMWMVGLWLAFRSRTPLARFCAQYALCAAIIGLQADTLGGWGYPVILSYVIGLSVGLACVARRRELSNLNGALPFSGTLGARAALDARMGGFFLHGALRWLATGRRNEFASLREVDRTDSIE